MLNDLLSVFGYSQKWHVCWVVKIPGRELSMGDGVFTIAPRLNEDAIPRLREKLADMTSIKARHEVKAEQVNITGITRIGR